MNRAILLLFFNRSDTLKEVFYRIKKAKPPRIYLAQDGARKEISGEREKIDAVRQFVLENIDWPCEIKTKFNIENMGCAKAVSSALDWFFEYEEDGIILEDDCVPDLSFFDYAETLLDYYRENKNIWHISGYNFLKFPKMKESYYFSAIPHVWGWATWKDRWEKFEFDISNYDKNNFKHLTKNKVFQAYWLNVLDDTKNKKVDSWAYRWFFTILKHRGISIVPGLNLVNNIGISGTHFNSESSLLNTETYNIGEIIHPKNIKIKKHIMDRMLREWFFIDDRPALIRKIQLFIKKKEWRKIWLLKFLFK